MAHVLLVEDEMLLAQVFQAALEDEGHRVTAAGDGVSALSADALDPAEVLVTDLRMPRMGGRELVAHIRERRPGLPVVVLSGYALDAGEIGGGAAAATVLLSKPVSPRALAEEVTGLLARVAGGPAAVAVVPLAAALAAQAAGG